MVYFIISSKIVTANILEEYKKYKTKKKYFFLNRCKHYKGTLTKFLLLKI